jgi:hypothetical protein
MHFRDGAWAKRIGSHYSPARVADDLANTSKHSQPSRAILSLQSRI